MIMIQSLCFIMMNGNSVHPHIAETEAKSSRSVKEVSLIMDATLFLEQRVQRHADGLLFSMKHEQ